MEWTSLLVMAMATIGLVHADTMTDAQIPIAFQILIYVIVVILALALVWCFIRWMIQGCHRVRDYFNGGYDYNI